MPTFISTATHNEKRPRRSTGVTVGDFTFATVTALDPATGRRAGDTVTITDEIRRCFASIDDVLGQAGLTRADLIKTTCWVSDDAHRPEFLEAYLSECAPGVYPERVTMRAGLPGDCRVAIEAVAARS
ncbi:RidA family protein [Streptomyces sp. NPDC048425]|uniref:RidA family protein n=1 Tax=Streptomyces sp. NPDC048425 TaxID=3365548 RepID=UPI0037113247